MTYTAWIIVTASLVGMSCGLIGVFLILRKMAMMADAISHTVLVGIVFSFYHYTGAKWYAYACWSYFSWIINRTVSSIGSIH